MRGSTLLAALAASGQEEELAAGCCEVLAAMAGWLLVFFVD